MSIVASEGIKRSHTIYTGGYRRRRRPSNHEDRPSLTSEANKNSFGIYRPLSKDSLCSLQEMSSRIVEKTILPKIAETRSPFCIGKFVVKDQMGVTYLKHSQMRQKQVRKELKNSEFKLRLERDEIRKEAYNPDDLVVDINLDHFEWMDDHERSLAFFLDHGSDGYAELEEMQAHLREVLGAYSPALARSIKEPDHIKFLKYGNGREINQLNHKEKQFCIDQLATTMQQIGVTAVALAPLNFGPNYNEPAPAWAEVGTHRIGSLALR